MLTNCDQEPIHIPGAIQPHGLLVAVDKRTLTIRYASANAQPLIGMACEELLGAQIESIGRTAEDRILFELLRDEFTTSKPTYLFTVRLGRSETLWDTIGHAQDACIILEFEPSRSPSGLDTSHLYRGLQSALVRLEEAQSVLKMSEICAQQIRSLTGFDRVMVYRFDREWNGEVIAESKREDLESFYGLHYPASDIPQQARELYTKNWLRFITDRDYAAAALIADSAVTSGQVLDQSFSVLRSVSPIHLEYLRNMGVCASMSISILRDGVLWGLIACHHCSPRYVPYDVRRACELLAHFMSLRFASAEQQEFRTARARTRATSEALLQKITVAADPFTALLGDTPNLLDFVPCSGAAVVLGTQCLRIGHAPPESDIQNLTDWFLERDEDRLATDRLQTYFGGAVLSAVAAGVLAIAISRRQRFVVYWFRPEQQQIVNWAGNPEKLGDVDPAQRLSPRASFALWQETVRGRSLPWTDDEMKASDVFRQAIVQPMIRRAEEIAAAVDNMRLAEVERERTLQSERSARIEAERVSQMKDEFVATLSHELRTPLNAILGWSQLLQMEPGELPDDFKQGLAIIEQNARSQAVMIEDLMEISRIISGKIRLDVQKVDLADIVLSAVESVMPVADAKGIRLVRVIEPLHGAQTTADPNRLKQVIWNLLTNAVKFTPKNGNVQIILRKVESHAELTVVDSGIGISPELLPHIFDRYRQADSSTSRNYGGLGLGLAIVRTLVELHGGTVSAHSQGHDQGSRFVVTLPFAAAKQPEVPTIADTIADPAIGVCRLEGLRVLVVDDESGSRELLVRVLTSRGCLVQVADGGETALVLQDAGVFDIVVSDIGMPQMDGYEFIRRWRLFEQEHGRARIPAIALTAYARSEDRRQALIAGFQSHVTKPIEIGELVAVVGSLANR